MRYCFGILFTALIFLYVPAQGQTPPPAQKHEFNVQQCVEYAKKNNLQVKNALINVQLQEQTNRLYTAAAYPQISGSITSNFYPNITVQSFPNFISAATYAVLEQEGVKDGNGNTIKSPTDFGFIQAAFGTKWTASVGISLQQILFDGQVFVGLQARQTSLDYAKKNYDITEESIRTNVYKVYYQLVISKTSVAQIDANIARLQKLKHDAEALFKNGFAEKLDVDRTEVQLANLLTQKRNTDNLISNGYLGLKMLIGMPMADTLVLTDTVTDEGLKEGLLNEGIYQYTDRNDYQYLQFVRKLNDYNVRRYKLTKIPTVSLSSGYSKLAQRNEFSFLGKGDWFSSSYVGLNINIPIFKGFATNANIKTAQLQLQQTQNQIDNLKIAIDNEVNTAENNYHNAVASIDAQLRNVKLAEEVYNQTQKKYQAGLGTTTDISNAQADLIEAQQNYTAALYDAAIAKIDYLKAIGKLP